MYRIPLVFAVFGVFSFGCGSSSSGGASPGGDAATDVGDASDTSPADTNVSDVAHVVGDCSNLGAAGSWVNVTPPQLNSSQWCVPGSTGCSDSNATYGAHFFALDPSHSGTILLGTSSLGLWKSTDCGATWAKIDTGKNGDQLDKGRNWTIAIDPTDSNVIYTNAGYGPSGVFKSTNGGVDWDQMLTADVAASIPYQGFVEKITLDPTNHLHVLVSFHDKCTNAPNSGGEWGCLAESSDGGASWKLIASATSWSEGDGQTMIDAKTWFFGNGGVGIWRTTDGGGNWARVYTGEASGAVFTAKDGTYYVVGGQRVLHSSDGVSWAEIDGSHGGGSVNGSLPFAETETTLFMSGGAYGGEEPATGWYFQAKANDPSTWTPAFDDATMGFGGSNLAYDADHKVLYSSNLTTGFWRVVVP